MPADAVEIGGPNDEREAVNVTSRGYRQQQEGHRGNTHDRQPSRHTFG